MAASCLRERPIAAEERARTGSFPEMALLVALLTMER
jgi:hypothetical protein